LQTFNEPGRNLIEPQTKLGGVTLASAAPFEGCDVNRNPFSSDHDMASGGSLPFSRVAPASCSQQWRRVPCHCTRAAHRLLRIAAQVHTQCFSTAIQLSTTVSDLLLSTGSPKMNLLPFSATQYTIVRTSTGKGT